MWKIKRVPVEEFAEHAAEYLEGHDAVTIEKDGQVIGRYVPEPNGHATNDVAITRNHRKGSPEARAARERLEHMLQEMYARTGLTEDEFVAAFLADDPVRDDGSTES
jgi:hypothetical protein